MQHSNTKIISKFKSYSHYMQPIIQTFTNATRLWVSVNIVHSSPTNMGHKQHTDLEYHSQFKAMQTKGEQTPQFKTTNTLKHLLNTSYTKNYSNIQCSNCLIASYSLSNWQSLVCLSTQ